ncbi:hypothetical protein K488DRAFT_54556, partial [Vararia minispora EC-137]
DAIVLWRMCILWKDSITVLALAAVLWFATVGPYISYLPFLPVGPLSYTNSTIQPVFSDTAIGTATLILSLASNLIATSLISWRAWRHRQEIRDHLISGTRRTMVERLLALLVESGVLYCAVWVNPFDCSVYSGSFDYLVTDFVYHKQQVGCSRLHHFNPYRQ